MTRSPAPAKASATAVSGSPDTGSEDERVALRTWLRLLTCANLIERRVRAGLREEFQTTLPRFDVLAELDAVEGESDRGLTMSELSRRLMVTNGNVTGLVMRLAQERLVTRSVSVTDGRTQIVRLTRDGKKALDDMVPVHRAWIEQMFGAVTPPDRVLLHEMLGRLRDSARAATEDV